MHYKSQHHALGILAKWYFNRLTPPVMGCPHSLQDNLCWFVPSSGSPYCQNGSKGFGILARQYSTSNFKPRAKENEKNEHQTLLEKKSLLVKKKDL
jgi:hypothetical protein